MIEIKASTIHGKGVFATVPIKKGTLIGQFEGKRTAKDGMHVLWLFDEEKECWYGIKGENSLIYLNHSPLPNAEFTNRGELFALKRIKRGEEITIHYGEEWE